MDTNTDKMKLIFRNHDESSIMMHKHISRIVLNVSIKSGVAASVYMLLISWMDDNNTVVATREAMCHFLRVSPGTITRCVKILVEAGLITISQVGGNRMYHIVDEFEGIDTEDDIEG